MEFICPNCGRKFYGNKNIARVFCSRECKDKSQTKPTKIVRLTDGSISAGTTGAISEIIACSFYLMGGYEVFRAMSPASSCDLIITKNNTVIRVEVRTAAICGDRITLAVKRSDRGRFDVMCVVTSESIYELGHDFFDWDGRLSTTIPISRLAPADYTRPRRTNSPILESD